ncbi:short-chain dehydrogenase [Agrobacterium tumefaciens]|uniref:NnrS family protein n=1 Tax=Agrobacterium TaxID=357 RepID=UPI00115C85DF|nr:MULTISPECIES: NnrS family protein [Agrobacterium]MDA5242801.1 NnrS family protein [Agrobacterium sp. MAFF310724]MDA5247703.1 NnrS family protein [Agrobacterium sp. MAFF210268]TRB12992.1 short-chain dehydrogenase [Agrobacterium tumefaciens]
MSGSETVLTQGRSRPKGGIPRGLARTGPVIFSYGFRPFFLGGALWAIVAMVLWIAALSGFIDLGGDYGAPNWHAHEMLFGFASAVLAGFLLTAVPNWTGRLPVSGKPLVWLFALWCAGRLFLLVPGTVGLVTAAAVDGLFLPALLAICAREVIAGRKWKDLKVLGGLLALSVANIVFHVAAIGGDHSQIATRLAVSAYTVLVIIVGGRIVPSFTRNWLNRFGRTDFPVPYNGFDTAAILIGIAALAVWTIEPESIVAVPTALLAAFMHAVRLIRWRGWTTWPEQVLVVLHVAYAFIPAGFITMALAALDVMDTRSVLHVFTVGVIGCMMLAVMTRASLGHTGRKLAASRVTIAAYVALIACALLRPAAEFFPGAMMHLYACSALFWIVGFGLFCVEYGPILMRERKPLKA